MEGSNTKSAHSSKMSSPVSNYRPTHQSCAKPNRGRLWWQPCICCSSWREPKNRALSRNVLLERKMQWVKFTVRSQHCWQAGVDSGECDWCPWCSVLQCMLFKRFLLQNLLLLTKSHILSFLCQCELMIIVKIPYSHGLLCICGSGCE